MAKRVMKEGMPEYDVFMAVWNLWKNYGTPEESDKYWDDLIEASAKVATDKRFADCMDLASELSKAICNTLDARAAGIKKYGDDKHGFQILLERDKERNNG